MSAKTMAELDTTYKLPTVSLDQTHLHYDRRGSLKYELTTPDGIIAVLIYGEQLCCSGTQEALIAYGLVKPEWLPGHPGNGYTANSVVFDASGPRIVVGRRTGARNQPYMHIRAWGHIRHTVNVRLPMTPEQIEQVKAWRAREEQQHEEQKRQERDCSTRYRTIGNVIYLQSRT
ncbi:MAG: hypothetical protein WC073_05245 [Sterolibacterium sp.]